MGKFNHDRVGMVATRFIRDAADRMRADARSAGECLQCGSTPGVRHHLQSLRRSAERSARIERNILHTSSHAARLRRVADAALVALDAGSPTRLARALERVETLAR